MARELHDHYFREAKREGYLSRAAYKLIEIDKRKELMQRGDRVLDCGAAPGSWLQVISKRIGPQGIVVGVDKKPIDHVFDLDNVRCVQGDLVEIEAEELLSYVADDNTPGPSSAASSGPASGERFDVILSDMAPDTTGDHTTDHFASARLCHAVLDRCQGLLVEDGHLAMKVLEGESHTELLARCRALFAKVKGFVPKASRHKSTEIYIIARGFRGDNAAEADRVQRTADHPPLPARRRSTGWTRWRASAVAAE